MSTLDWWRHALHKLVALNDGPWRWREGMQAGLASGLPLALFVVSGRQADGLVAMLGAFTALYFAHLRLVDRLRVMPWIAVGFTVAAAIGAFASGGIWLTVAALVIVAVIAAGLSFSFGIGPPGPMMFVLVAGVSGHLSAPRHLGGADMEPLRIVVLIAIGAVSAYLIVVAPLAIPAVRRRQGPPSPHHVLISFSSFDNISAVIFTRVVLGVTITSLFSIPLGRSRAYWAILTAGVLLQTGHTLSIPTTRAVQRVIGTILGVVIFTLLAPLDPAGLEIVMIVAICQFMTEAVIVRNYGLGLLFITPLALTISTANGTTDAIEVSQDRIVDTILGAAIALIVLFAGEWLRTHREQVIRP